MTGNCNNFFLFFLAFVALGAGSVLKLASAAWSCLLDNCVHDLRISMPKLLSFRFQIYSTDFIVKIKLQP